ncbi:ASCH domain-containing protein [Glycomyces salinus]|uniref:ASCH domain-containing protein n=1 Tax=Glycomyces salinus TaxID=980294 RepID=UPI0018EB23ED|nr:ASCH domain-containing protein [Glycomyces salinus]
MSDHFARGLRALTVRQPWAHLIAHGGKTIENRTRKTTYRGPVAVHAGKTLAVAEWEWARHHLGARAVPDRDRLALGAVVAVADLVDCHAAGWPSACGTEACNTWGESHGDAWHWVLDDIRPLTAPVPAHGQLGLWTPDDNLTAAITAAMNHLEQ